MAIVDSSFSEFILDKILLRRVIHLDTYLFSNRRLCVFSMTSPIQFHPIHGEHIKLSKGNTIAKRVDSFCKGICFSHRPIHVRERIHVRLLSKSVQWTGKKDWENLMPMIHLYSYPGFLRLGMTTCDPQTHRSSEALPRHACPDLTCRPGRWIGCDRSSFSLSPLRILGEMCPRKLF